MLRLLESKNYTNMPWKNGGGSTLEIVRFPETEPFDWRMSIATVGASGPFSAFPGVDRFITALGGSTLSLHHETPSGPSTKVLEHFQPHEFAGEWATEGVLDGPAARDFNFMVRREFGSGRMQSVAFRSTENPVLHSKAPLFWIFCAQGPVQIHVSGRSTPVEIDEDDTLEVQPWAPGEEIEVRFRGQRNDAVVIVCEIFPHLPMARRKFKQDPRAHPAPHGKPEHLDDPDALLMVPAPEDFLPSPKKPLTRFQIWPQAGSALWASGMLLMMTIISILYWQKRIDWSASQAAIVDHGEWWRLVSALFVHGDLSHLLNNSWTFHLIGWVLRAYFRWTAFPLLALVLGVVSNGVTVAFYEPQMRVIGASGMIYGMVALWLTLYVYFDRQSPFTHRVIRTVGFAVMILFPQTYDAKTSYLAHGAGFIAGIGIGLATLPFFKKNEPNRIVEPPPHGPHS